jgi:8-oxo-dGTP diphosphatase
MERWLARPDLAMGVVRVVAAVLYDADRRVLIAQRPEGKQHAGFWEFPGGKVEPGETESACLIRELREELGIEVQQQQLLMTLQHEYPDRSVRLAVWLVDQYQGIPHGAEGQLLSWVTLPELPSVKLLPADWPIVETLLRTAAAASNIHDNVHPSADEV